MKNLIFTPLLLTSLLVPSAHAAPIKALFGTSRFTPSQNHTVTGPLVQLQTEGGATLSFQQGAKFNIEANGTITLTSGNLRVGPAGDSPLTLNLPQGPVTIAPLTALTITVNNAQTTGRIYHGNVEAEGRTFTSGEGFVLTPSGARGTYTPAPAQAPALTEDFSRIEPAAAPATNSSTPPVILASRTPATTIRPAANTPETTQPTPENPTPELPTIEEPTSQPLPEPEPQPEPQPEPELPAIPTPEPEPQPEPEPEPIAELPPTPITRAGLIASFSEKIPDIEAPDNVHANTPVFKLNEYANGTQALTETQTSFFGLNPVRLNIGTAENLDIASNGPTAGLGRWVGGELLAVKNRASSLIANSTEIPSGTDEEPTFTTNSIHYVWGETPSAVPAAGRITYNLFSATQPTYSGATAESSTGATFTGNLAIDFTPPSSGVIGTYHFKGTVTMPQTVQTETGPTTSNVAYQISTGTTGVALNNNSFYSPGTLTVTAPTGALACPSGCTGTVNTAGFGTGMATAGTVYNINPDGPIGINGAALFTAAP